LGHRDLDVHERNLQAARERLGLEAFEARWSEGRSSTFEGALRDAVGIAAEIVAADRDGSTGAAPLVDLTPREVEVLHLVGQGRSNKDAARALGLSVRTVENHLAHIYLKLGVQSRVEAALLAHTLAAPAAG
jgi:non-specific serine/threonine protein kinase